MYGNITESKTLVLCGDALLNFLCGVKCDSEAQPLRNCGIRNVDVSRESSYIFGTEIFKETFK